MQNYRRPLTRGGSRLSSFVVTNPDSDILHYTILMLFVLAEIPLENCIEQLKLEKKKKRDLEEMMKELDSMSDVRKTKLAKIVKDDTVVSIKPVAFQSFISKKTAYRMFSL